MGLDGVSPYRAVGGSEHHGERGLNFLGGLVELAATEDMDGRGLGGIEDRVDLRRDGTARVDGGDCLVEPLPLGLVRRRERGADFIGGHAEQALEAAHEAAMVFAALLEGRARGDLRLGAESRRDARQSSTHKVKRARCCRGRMVA